MYKSPIMGAGRRGGGGLRVDVRPTTFPKKIHVGAFYFFLQKCLFSCGESFFLMRAFWGVCPLPPHPSYKELCWNPCPHPMSARRSFRRGVGNPKKPLIKTKKDIKTKKTPPLTWRKNSRKAPTR